MDTTTAQNTLQALINLKQAELDSLKLSLSILENTFAPDISSLKTAQDDADTQRNRAISAEAQVADLKTQIETVNPIEIQSEKTP